MRHWKLSANVIVEVALCGKVDTPDEKHGLGTNKKARGVINKAYYLVLCVVWSRELSVRGSSFLYYLVEWTGASENVL